MPWGNCLTAALRKRHMGTIRMVWCFNNLFPHFAVINWKKGEVYDVECEAEDARWWCSIHYLGEENTPRLHREDLLYPYKDVIKPWRPPNGYSPVGG